MRITTDVVLAFTVEGLMNRSAGQRKAKEGHLVTSASNLHVRRACEKNEQCGQYADCVALTPNEPKRCWCVYDLESPDPDTGGCRSAGSGHHHDRSRNGVFYPHHIQDIMSADGNVTAGGSTNETSPMLQPHTVESSVTLPWSQVILLACGSFLCVSILVLFILIYRRRYMIKQYCASRHTDVFTRHSDGVILLDRMNHIKNNPTYFCHNNVLTRLHNVPELCFEHLKLEEVVGEGAFGQVFKGHLLNPENATHRQVAVKVLRDGTTPEAREDFDREVEIMSAFDHDNILKLLGVVVQGMDGNPYMIFEYMEHGDLSELLRKNDPLLRSSMRKSVAFNKTDLVDVCVQIANGMTYLSARKFVHRDLATRNCLVGNGLIVKISDFGMSRDIYTCDYYKVGGSRMLPVRWMSPEAIKYGRFTCESDIWAYGVVLWEIFSYGKQPYCGHTNDEVIHFLDQGILLQRPEDCPSTVYHVMLGCWKKDPRERIIFERLAKYLSDFRNRLSKPSPSLQQRCPDLASNGAKFLNSEMNVYVVGIPEKGTVIAADSNKNQYTQQASRSTTIENKAEQLNYICVGKFTNTDNDVSIRCEGRESPARMTNICEANWKSTSNARNGFSSINREALHTSERFDVSEKQKTHYSLINGSIPIRNVSTIKERSLRSVLSLDKQTEPRSEKMSARKTSSCPLSVQTDKQLGPQTDRKYGHQTDKQSDQKTDASVFRHKDNLNQHIVSFGEGGYSSQTFSIPTCQQDLISKSSSSALELSPSWSSLSETSRRSTENVYDVQGYFQPTNTRKC